MVPWPPDTTSCTWSTTRLQKVTQVTAKQHLSTTWFKRVMQMIPPGLAMNSPRTVPIQQITRKQCRAERKSSTKTAAPMPKMIGRTYGAVEQKDKRKAQYIPTVDTAISTELHPLPMLLVLKNATIRETTSASLVEIGWLNVKTKTDNIAVVMLTQERLSHRS